MFCVLSSVAFVISFEGGASVCVVEEEGVGSCCGGCCLFVRWVSSWSLAFSSSRAMVLCNMTLSKCWKNRTWSCLLKSSCSSVFVGMTVREEGGRYCFGIVLLIFMLF